MASTHLARLVCTTCVAVGMLWGGGAAVARGEAAGDDATAAWLVHLARDYGLNHREAPQPADVQHVTALLRAAHQLDPDAAEPLEALLELALLRGNQREVAALVDRLVVLRPEHADLAARWLALHLSEYQTTEKRQRWLSEVLADETHGVTLRALACVELAQLAHARLEDDQATEWLRRARELQPDQPAATLAAFAWLTPDDPPLHRLDTALNLLALNLLHVEAAWEAALALDQVGASAEAAILYQYAVRVYRTTHTGAELPATYMLDLMHNALALGRTEDAAQIATHALLIDPQRYEAAFVLHWLLDQAGRDEDADKVREMMAAHFGMIRDPNAVPLHELSQASWFHCRLEPQPRRALMLAQAAAARAPDDIFVRRVLGWSQALNLEDEAALKTLQPIAGDDPYAAYMAAKLLREAGREAAADALLEPYADRSLVGPAQTLLAELQSDLSTQPTTQPKTQPTTQPTMYADVSARLREFDPNQFQWFAQPNRLLVPAMRAAAPSFAPGEPWRVEFSLTNTGPHATALGPGWAVNPVFLLTVSSEGDRPRAYPALLTVELDGVRLLRPGETVSVQRRIDVGPLARVNSYTPQQLQRIEVKAVFDPVQDERGRWRSSLQDMDVAPLYFNRTPALTDEAALRRLLDELRGGAGPAAFVALRKAAALVGEQQRLQRGGLKYRPQPLAVEPLVAALHETLQHDDWRMRARALEALQVMGLDAELVKLARTNLQHEHPVVRMMATRLLARAGRRFATGAAELAQHDADPNVRLLAQSYLSQWTTDAE